MSRSSRTFSPLAALFCLFVLLGVLYTFPLIRYVRAGTSYTHYPQPGNEVLTRAPGDYLQFYYHLWLLKDALTGHTPLFMNPYEFAVEQAAKPPHLYFLPVSLIFVLFSPLGGVVAYNAFLLSSFGLAGLSAYLLARRIVNDPWPALLAGAVFALAPYRLGSLLGGHPTGFVFFLMPLIFLCLDYALVEGSWAASVLAGLLLLSLPGVEPHFLFLLALVLPFYLLIRLLPPVGGLLPFRELRGSGFWRTTGGGRQWAKVLGLGCIPGLAWEIARRLPDQAGWVSRGFVGRTLAFAALILLAWLLAGLLLAGARREPLDESFRQALGLLVPLWAFALYPLNRLLEIKRFGLALAVAVLSAVGLLLIVALHRHPRGREALLPVASRLRHLLPAGIGMAGSVVLMLYIKKTVLDLSIVAVGRSLREISLFSPRVEDFFHRGHPSAVEQVYPGLLAVLLAIIGVLTLFFPAFRVLADRRILIFSGLLFLLSELFSMGPFWRFPPLYHWAYEFLPFFSFLRQTSKFQVMALLALALLVAIGAKTLMAPVGSRPFLRWGVGALLLVGLLADYWPIRPPGISLLPGRNAIYDRLREVDGAGRVLYIPVWPGESAWSSLYQYAATLTRTPMVNGYAPAVSTRYVNEVYWPLDPTNWGEITEREYATLEKLGVTHLVLDRGAFPSKVSPFPSGFTLKRLLASPYVSLTGVDNPLWLFTLKPAGHVQSGSPQEPFPTSPQGIFYEAERMHRRVGRIVEDSQASGGKAVAVASGEAGPDHLVFGANVGLPRGSYRVLFRLRGQGPPSEPVGVIEVAAELGTRSIARQVLTGRDLPEAFGDRVLTFTVDSPLTVEFRVFWGGRGQLAVDYIYALFSDQSDPRPLYDLEELSHAFLLVRDQAGRWVPSADPRETARDHLLTGPFRRYPSGRYVARFRMRVDGRSDAPMAWLGMASAQERKVLGERLVRPSELTSVGVYQEIEVPFRLEIPTVMEFLVRYEGGTGFSLDRIGVEPVPGS